MGIGRGTTSIHDPPPWSFPGSAPALIHMAATASLPLIHTAATASLPLFHTAGTVSLKVTFKKWRRKRGGQRGQAAPPSSNKERGQTCPFAPPKIYTLKVVLSIPHKPTAGRAQLGPLSSTQVTKFEYLVIKIIKNPNKF